MLYIAENLKHLRKSKDITQEETAEILGVSPQSVSKWERGEACPDITLLPALANLYSTTIDALIGMDKINSGEAITEIFKKGKRLVRGGDVLSAAEVYSTALKSYPNDEGIMSDLAMALALTNDTESLKQAVGLCDRVLRSTPTEKVRHSTRAALCFIYYKSGDTDKANETAQNLPHIRESREMIMERLRKKPGTEEADAYLRFLLLGEDDEQDIIEILLGVDMIKLYDDYGLGERLKALREELGGIKHLPITRIRDDINLNRTHVRVRYMGDFILDRDFDNLNNAAEEIIAVIKKAVIK